MPTTTVKGSGAPIFMPRQDQSRIPGDKAGSTVFVVSNWKPFEKNALRGFFTLTLPSGLVIHNCSLFQKGEGRWIGMPSNKFTTKEGTTSYTPIVEFVSREVADKFRDQALEALDLIIGGKND